tara:strand:+ start:685 stop:1548 length:864 start_codon:yes stop_codon:yes gene_type:complete
MPDISFPSSPSGGDTYTYNNITFTYDGEKWTAKAPVSTTGTYGNANVASYVSSQGIIGLTDISVTTETPSGNGSLAYSNVSGVFTFTPADASGSGGNYGDSNVASFLSTNSYSNVAYNDSNVASFLSTNSYSNVAYGNTEVQAYLDAQNYSNTAVSSSSETTFTADVKFNTGVEERFQTLTGQSGTVIHNCNDGHVFYHTTPAGDITANFINLGLTAEYTTSITIIINQGVSPRVISAVQIGGAAQTIEWQGGSAPSGTANSIDAFSFTILNDAGSYIVLGQMVDFA